MYKLVQKKPLEAYRNTFCSLAINLVTASEPFAPAFETTVLNGKVRSGRREAGAVVVWCVCVCEGGGGGGGVFGPKTPPPNLVLFKGD
jgi:hypothetical protein